MIKILTCLLLVSATAGAQTITGLSAATSTAIRKIVTDAVAAADKRNADTARAQRAEYLAALAVQAKELTAVKALYNSLPVITPAQMATILAADSLIKGLAKQVTGINTAVWSNMNAVSKRLQDNITADSLYLLTLNNKINALSGTSYASDISKLQGLVSYLQDRLADNVTLAALIKQWMDKVKEANK